jgi:thymidylate kinase
LRTLDLASSIAPTDRTAALTSLPLLIAALEDFYRQEISYCYWKSRKRLPAVLHGDGDLDILVSEADHARAQTALIERGFRRLTCAFGQDHPSMESFIGFDEHSGRLVHVHLYSRLIVGEPLFPNYRLPWENTLLSRAISHQSLPTRLLDPASEALLLMVRSCVELSPLDPVALKHRRTKQDRFASDLKSLRRAVDREELRYLADDLLGEDIADMVVDVLDQANLSESLARLRPHMRRRLAALRAYNALEARLRAAARALLHTFGKTNKAYLNLPRPWRRRCPGGGRMIAIMGVDGSGKSTALAMTRAWLGSEIDVLPIYFGTGDGRPSLFLLPFKLLIPLFSRLIKSRPKGSSHGQVSGAPPTVPYTIFMTVWATLVALEKRHKLLAARRAVNRGLVVITDRYPQNEIISFNDGPLLPRLAHVPRWLRRFESNAYALATLLKPDLVVKLLVSPRTAAEREPDMDLDVIRDRIESLGRLTLSGAPTVLIDAEKPLADVHRDLRQAIWRAL